MKDETVERPPLPLLTADIPGIGGVIKSRSEHFQVDEIPLFEPGGEGEHVYVTLTRSDMNSGALRKRLGDLFDLRDVDVGMAGRKDKWAVATQSFSLRLGDMDEDEVRGRIGGEPGVTVRTVTRHTHKLRTGQLRGNRFRIVVSDPVGGAEERAAGKVEAIRGSVLANFYGDQRFGVDNQNVSRGLEILRGRRGGDHWKRRFMVSSVQSWLFNGWLRDRIERGDFHRLLSGDVAHKTDTGGLFVVEDLAVETVRFEAGEIDYTGPIFGGRMRSPSGDAAPIESELLSRADLDPAAFGRTGADGTRRPARLRLPGLEWESHDDGLLFSFELPKGSYATVVMAEIMGPGEGA